MVEAIERHDGSWPRELAIQLSGFAAGLLVGAAAVFLLSPLGWVTVAVSAALGSMFADKIIQGVAEKVWDYFHSPRELKCPPGKVPATIGIQLASSIQPSMSTVCAETIK